MDRQLGTVEGTVLGIREGETNGKAWRMCEILQRHEKAGNLIVVVNLKGGRVS